MKLSLSKFFIQESLLLVRICYYFGGLLRKTESQIPFQKLSTPHLLLFIAQRLDALKRLASLPK